MVEFYGMGTETVESAIHAIEESTECGIPVWRKRSSIPPHVVESSEMRQQRSVGILSSLDIRQQRLVSQITNLAVEPCLLSTCASKSATYHYLFTKTYKGFLRVYKISEAVELCLLSACASESATYHHLFTKPNIWCFFVTTRNTMYELSSIFNPFLTA
ncbi:hypothetical protein Rs2_05111 [Raphanus sativus]|nr:hypothetical protein Rs2_05111 [Raphanus sativus]